MYHLSENISDRDVDAIHSLLRDTYWASGRTRAEFEESLKLSVAITAFDVHGKLVGFARAVTDKVTFSWICDVVVSPNHRGRGLARLIVNRLLEHPDVVRTRKILVTKDAQALYRHFGFSTHPYECMVSNPGDHIHCE